MPDMQVIEDADGDFFHIEEVPAWRLAGADPVVPYFEIVVRHPSGCILGGTDQAAALRDWLNQWLAEQGQGAGEEADDGRVS